MRTQELANCSMYSVSPSMQTVIIESHSKKKIAIKRKIIRLNYNWPSWVITRCRSNDKIENQIAFARFIIVNRNRARWIFHHQNRWIHASCVRNANGMRRIAAINREATRNWMKINNWTNQFTYGRKRASRKKGESNLKTINSHCRKGLQFRFRSSAVVFI